MLKELESDVFQSAASECTAAFKAAGEGGNSDCAKIAAAMQGRPRIQKIVTHLCYSRYEQYHPEADMTKVDWATIINWIVNTGLSLILQIIAAFGG